MTYNAGIYDLHCHSYYSDGALSPHQLLQYASEQGVQYLALTDHDSIEGIAEAQQAAQHYGVHLIPGVEISCHWRNRLVHVVGLNIDIENPDLTAGLEANKKLRQQRAQAMLDDLSKHGIEIEHRLLQKKNPSAVYTRPHFAQALVEEGLAKDMKQAFKRYLVPGKPGYIPMQWPDISEISQWIKSASGVAVLAHPTRYKLSRTKLIELVRDMKTHGICALEASSPIIDTAERRTLAQICKEYHLLASIGSDFHNHSQVWARLGSAKPLDASLTPVWSAF